VGKRDLLLHKSLPPGAPPFGSTTATGPRP
jgi:hypothetical protein